MLTTSQTIHEHDTAYDNKAVTMTTLSEDSAASRVFGTYELLEAVPPLQVMS